MEKQILKSHEGKERGYKISVNYNRDGEPCNVYVKKSVRTATGVNVKLKMLVYSG